MIQGEAEAQGAGDGAHCHLLVEEGGQVHQAPQDSAQQRGLVSTDWLLLSALRYIHSNYLESFFDMRSYTHDIHILN